MRRYDPQAEAQLKNIESYGSYEDRIRYLEQMMDQMVLKWAGLHRRLSKIDTITDEDYLTPQWIKDDDEDRVGPI